MHTNFGEYIAEKRKNLRKTLREFSRENGFDPGYVSKIERGLLPPPQHTEKKEHYAKSLGINVGSDDWQTFCDLASIGAGKIPDRIVSDKRLLSAMPIFFRSVKKEGIDKETMNRLVETLKKEI